MRDLAVVIPVYNDLPGLLETLESIRESDNGFTVIVVDDGSREPIELDESRYPFSVRVLRQDPNGGIVRALNAGLEQARADGFDLVARLDAADLQRPNRLKRQYDYLQENSGIDLVGSNVFFLDEETREALFETDLPLDHRRIRRWMVFRNCFIHPSVMFRTSVLETTGLYRETYRHIEDYDLFSRIVRNHRTANLAEPLVDCLVRKCGISLLHQRAQLLAGIRYRLHHPRPFDPLWHAYLAKRLSYFLLPHGLRNELKIRLGFARKPAATEPIA